MSLCVTCAQSCVAFSRRGLFLSQWLFSISSSLVGLLLSDLSTRSLNCGKDGSRASRQIYFNKFNNRTESTIHIDQLSKVDPDVGVITPLTVVVVAIESARACLPRLPS